MKKLLTYIAFFLLTASVQYAYASRFYKVETGNKPKKENQEQGQQQTEPSKSTEELPDQPILGAVSGEVPVEQDSVLDDSVGKYNFILYFLYKFKYEEEESF